MRKLVYYVASSLDGFIAREDGSLADFEMGGEHFADLIKRFPETIPGHLRGQLGVNAENARFDTVVMGRRTFEVASKIGITNPYPHLDQYVVSQTLGGSPDSSVQWVREDPVAMVRGLKEREGKDIWLCGGGTLARALLPVIDEMVLKINPFLMGTGIALISGDLPKTSLEPIAKTVYDSGFMLLDYKVRH